MSRFSHCNLRVPLFLHEIQADSFTSFRLPKRSRKLDFAVAQWITRMFNMHFGVVLIPSGVFYTCLAVPFTGESNESRACSIVLHHLLCCIAFVQCGLFGCSPSRRNFRTRTDATCWVWRDGYSMHWKRDLYGLHPTKWVCRSARVCWIYAYWVLQLYCCGNAGLYGWRWFFSLRPNP